MDSFRKQKLLWLGINLFMVITMVIIGGITRLTDSGLSMTDWNLIKGIIPPLNEYDWVNLFQKYKQYPEYNIKNFDMTLVEFKKIFFWEYFHRIWGRLVGLTFFVPLIYLWLKKAFSDSEKKILTLLSLLGLFQAFMGWYMVKSGLAERPDVSHFRLSIHLSTAFLIYSILLYFFWKLFKSESSSFRIISSKHYEIHKRNLTFSFLLLIITISAGALVSGTEAGLSYNNFPLMGDSLLPPILYEEGGLSFKKLIYDQGFLQFLHRIVATFTLLFVLHTVFKANKDGLFDDYKFLFYSLTLVILLQYTLGIIILKLYVPTLLGLMHQLGALIALSLITISICEVRYKNKTGRKYSPR